jgi:drug/metabolite transporter (DMT)-like permease
MTPARYPPPRMWFGILMGLLASASWAAANVFVQRASRELGPFRALVWARAHSPAPRKVSSP